MDDDVTDRLALPLLHAGQAQKEMTHNEALALLDIAVAACVEAIGPVVPPVDPVPGQCWIVGPGATGAWGGEDGSIAGWTVNGWRFVRPREGMRALVRSDGSEAIYRDAAWRAGEVSARALWIGGRQVVGAQGAAIAEPASGSVIDEKCRLAVAAILMALRDHGLIASP